MKYKKCPRCELNYVTENQSLCSVCQDELSGKKSIFDGMENDQLICPICYKNSMDIDECMCKDCAKRYHKSIQ